MAWRKPPEATDQQFKRDNYECNRDASGKFYGEGVGALDAQSKATALYNQCMESKGYLLVPVDAAGKELPPKR